MKRIAGVMKANFAFITGLACFAVIAGYGSLGAAQECIRFESIPEGATITLRSTVTISAKAPGIFCSLDPGQRYRLSIGKPGHEEREVGFSISPDQGQLSFSSGTIGSMSRSVVLPGWGQIAAGERWRGIETFLGSVAVGLVWYRAYRDYIDERDRFRFFSSAADEASKEADRNLYIISKRASSRLTNAQRRHMWEVAGLAGWTYASNLVEAFLVSSPPRVSVEGSKATLEVPRKSKARAIARSIFSPGMGQEYLGKSFKGFLFQSAFIALAALTLDARRDYDIATIEYELASEALGQAKSQAEIEVMREILSSLWDERRDEEKKRNAYYIAAGSLWLLNVIDASFSSADGAPARGFGFETSYHPSGARAGIRIGF